MIKLNLEDRLVVGSLIVGMAGCIAGGLLADPRLCGIAAFVTLGILVVGTIATRNPRLMWLLLFGLVAGVLELWSDWLHVEYLRSLVYLDYFGVKLLASPLYMPAGWWMTCIQFGYITLRLSDRFPKWVSVGLVSLLGMSLPPWYEEFAAPAGAWYYNPSPLMLSNTPVWIILTYGGCMFGIATMVLLCYRSGGWRRAVLGGFFTAAGFTFSAAFWFSLLG